MTIVDMMFVARAKAVDPTQPQPSLPGNLDRSKKQRGTHQPGAYECATYRREG